MTVQIVDIAGQKMAMLPVADYERLLNLAEDRLDGAAAHAAQRRRADGEEYLPIELADRIMNGESALRVWRQYRGLTLDQLSKKVGIGLVFLSQIERGERKGSPGLWRKLAEELDVSADDILPEA